MKGEWPCEARADGASSGLDTRGSPHIQARIGLDWTRLDWTGLDWTGLDWTGLDWTGLDWTGLIVAVAKK
jgi:hypothetical protein